MKKKEIEAEIREKIKQLINELHEIPDDIIKNESGWIEEALKHNLILEECLIISIKYLVDKAFDNINRT